MKKSMKMNLKDFYYSEVIEPIESSVNINKHYVIRGNRISHINDNIRLDELITNKLLSFKMTKFDDEVNEMSWDIRVNIENGLNKVFVQNISFSLDFKTGMSYKFDGSIQDLMNQSFISSSAIESMEGLVEFDSMTSLKNAVSELIDEIYHLYQVVHFKSHIMSMGFLVTYAFENTIHIKMDYVYELDYNSNKNLTIVNIYTKGLRKNSPNPSVFIIKGIVTAKELNDINYYFKKRKDKYLLTSKEELDLLKAFKLYNSSLTDIENIKRYFKFRLPQSDFSPNLIFKNGNDVIYFNDKNVTLFVGDKHKRIHLNDKKSKIKSIQSLVDYIVNFYDNAKKENK